MKIFSTAQFIFASLAWMTILARANEPVNLDKNSTATGFEAPDKYISDQRVTLEKYWMSSLLDLYPKEVNMRKKIINLIGDGYTQFIVDANGKFASDRPWFVTFINSKHPHCNMIQESLQHLAYYYQGDIQFAYVNRVLEEKLAYTFEVYHEKETFVPRSFLIDKDGQAYAFPLVLPAINTTTSWIDDKKYKNSPFKFKAPALMSDMKLKWGYLKKSVRLWYMENMLEKVEELLRKTKISYVVDLDPMDFENSRPYQKMDRQIILFCGIIGMTLESIWDWFVAAQTPTQKKIKKSFVDSSSSASDVKPSGPESLKKAGEKKKQGREKID